MVVGANFSSCSSVSPLFTYSSKHHNISRLCVIVNKDEMWRAREKAAAVILVVLMVA
jgi:hypothetical protein